MKGKKTMIELKVCDFCHNCSEFEPTVDRDVLHSDDFYGGHKTMVMTSVTCVHENRCISMMDYLVDRQAKGADGNGE